MRLITEFTMEQGETYTVLQILKRLRIAIVQIDGILFEHLTRIETLEDDVAQIKLDIIEIRLEIDGIKNRLDDIENRLDNIDDRLDGIDTKIITIENHITDIYNKLVLIETSISNLATIVNNHTQRIDELQLLVSSINETITNIISDINIVNDKIDVLQIQVDNIPIVSASPLNGYIRIDGNDTLVYLDDGSGTGGETCIDNTYSLPFKRFDETDFGTYKNVFSYVVGDEIERTMQHNILRYTFEYSCTCGVIDNINPIINFQLVVGGTQLNFGTVTFNKDAKNRNLILKGEIEFRKNETDDYNIRAMLRFFTCDPELWTVNTIQKIVFSSETGVVVVPQDTLKFNIMTQNSFFRCGGYVETEHEGGTTVGDWGGIFEKKLITEHIGSD